MARAKIVYHNRPNCINHGCGEPATYSHKDEQGNPRWRIHCSHCQGASWGKHPHRPGVTPYKTGRCSNHDEHLGFPCSTDFNKLPPWAKGMTEIDHIDGDSTNNNTTNLDELCMVCHRLKGIKEGDFNNARSTKASKQPPKILADSSEPIKYFSNLL